MMEDQLHPTIHPELGENLSSSVVDNPIIVPNDDTDCLSWDKSTLEETPATIVNSNVSTTVPLACYEEEHENHAMSQVSSQPLDGTTASTNNEHVPQNSNADATLKSNDQCHVPLVMMRSCDDDDNNNNNNNEVSNWNHNHHPASCSLGFEKDLTMMTIQPNASNNGDTHFNGIEKTETDSSLHPHNNNNSIEPLLMINGVEEKAIPDFSNNNPTYVESIMKGPFHDDDEFENVHMENRNHDDDNNNNNNNNTNNQNEDDGNDEDKDDDNNNNDDLEDFSDALDGTSGEENVEKWFDQSNNNQGNNDHGLVSVGVTLESEECISQVKFSSVVEDKTSVSFQNDDAHDNQHQQPHLDDGEGDDDFGDFEDAVGGDTQTFGQELVEVSSSAVLVHTKNPSTVDTDDLPIMDVLSVSMSGTSSTTVGQPEKTLLISQPNDDDDDDDDNHHDHPVIDDDFGNFHDDASTTTTTTTCQNQVQVLLAQASTDEINKLADTHDDFDEHKPIKDDFGNLKDAPVSQCSQLESSQLLLGETSSDVHTESNDANELGDRQPVNDDDDFGDFEDAPALQSKTAQESTIIESHADHDNSNSNDYDDFGDEFGDFSTFQESDTPDTKANDENPQLKEIKLSIESSRRILSNVFGSLLLSSDEAVKEEDGDDVKRLDDEPLVTVQSIMETEMPLECGPSQGTPEDLDELFKNIDNPIASVKLSPYLIVSSDCRDINSHFLFSAYWPTSSWGNNRLQSQANRPPAASRRHVPDVLHIQLPSGLDTPRTSLAGSDITELEQALERSVSIEATKSTVPSDDKTVDDSFAAFQSSHATTESESKLSNITENDAVRPSAAAQELLLRIPDLTFMLQKTLSLPLEK